MYIGPEPRLAERAAGGRAAARAVLRPRDAARRHAGRATAGDY